MGILGDLGNVGSGLYQNVGSSLVGNLPPVARKLASNLLGLKVNGGMASAQGVTAALRASPKGQQQDWRCKLVWPSAEQDYKSGVFSFLPGGNTVIWPYTPRFSIAYMANYDMIKTLQTNYGTPAYQGSEISNITIEGEFTATNVAEANYLYSVIHFMKSATKGFNLEVGSNAIKTGNPPKVLKLTYLGEGGVNDMPVVIQNFTAEYPKDVDYVRTDMVSGTQSSPDGPSPLARSAGSSMVPAEMSISITVVPAYSRADLISAKYSTTKFINGDLLGKGKGGFF